MVEESEQCDSAQKTGAQGHIQKCGDPQNRTAIKGESLNEGLAMVKNSDGTNPLVILKDLLGSLTPEQLKQLLPVKKNKPIAKRPVIQPLKNPKEVYEVGLQLKSITDRALFYFLYFFGVRVSEATSIYPADIVEDEYPTYGKVIILNSPNLKNRKQPEKALPAKAKTPEEISMLAYVMKYVELRKQTKPSERLFPIINNPENTPLKPNPELEKRDQKRRRDIVYQNFRKRTLVKLTLQDPSTRQHYVVIRSIHPHYLRKCRLTHLSKYHDFNPYKLQLYAGHSSLESGRPYIQYTSEDLLEG